MRVSLRWAAAVAGALGLLAAQLGLATPALAGDDIVGQVDASARNTGDGGEAAVDASLGIARSGRRGRRGGGTVVCHFNLVRSATGSPAPGIGDEVGSLEEGQLYIRTCEDTATGRTVSGPDFVIGPPAADPAAVVAVLVQRAVAQLPLPLPVAATNPSERVVVRMPVWLWVDGWRTEARTASAAGVSATVTARPVRVEWDTGDGGRTTCRGPGVPYDLTRPAAGQRTDCSYRYSRRSGPTTVEVTRVWALTWESSNGLSGDLGEVSRSSTLQLEVVELDTVLRGV